MSAFSVEEFVRDVRAAAAGEDAATGVRQLMDAAFADPAAVAEGMSGFKGEDEVLFEDDTVSIWYCGFDPEKHCLLYTSPSPRDQRGSRMPSSA